MGTFLIPRDGTEWSLPYIYKLTENTWLPVFLIADYHTAHMEQGSDQHDALSKSAKQSLKKARIRKRKERAEDKQFIKSPLAGNYGAPGKVISMSVGKNQVTIAIFSDFTQISPNPRYG